MSKIQKIAVIGGTGKAGKYLVGNLISRQYPVKMLTRNPEIITQKSPLIEVVQGNAPLWQAEIAYLYSNSGR